MPVELTFTMYCRWLLVRGRPVAVVPKGPYVLPVLARESV